MRTYPTHPCKYRGSGDANPPSEQFHVALASSMQAQRDEGKKVILCGDLNLSHRAIDSYPGYRSVRCDLVAATPSALPLPYPWLEDVRKHWNAVLKTLNESRRVVPQQTSGPGGVKYNKFRLQCLRLGSTTIYVNLGTPEANESWATQQFTYGPQPPSSQDDSDSSGEDKPNMPRALALIDIMKKIAGVEWDAHTVVADVATMTREGSSVVEAKSNPATVSWMDSLLEKDGMVDTFRQLHPDAEGRYTCFYQYTNRRYDNEGSRIDYVLADRSLADCLSSPPLTLSCGDPAKLDKLLPAATTRAVFEKTFDAAALAATFSGGFRPAPMEGGGMEEASSSGILSQFQPTSGIIYTPPQYSDHLAIEATFEFPPKFFPPHPAALLPGSAATQPHLAQRTLFDSFGGGTAKPSNPFASSKSAPKKKPLFASFTKSATKKPHRNGDNFRSGKGGGKGGASTTGTSSSSSDLPSGGPSSSFFAPEKMEKAAAWEGWK